MLYYYPNRPLLISHNQLQNFTGDNWTAEIKKNGDRLALQKICGRFCFMNRYKQKLKLFKPCKTLIEELENLDLPDNTQLDGELMHFHTKDVKQQIIFYDIYVLGGKQIYSELDRRREMLYANVKVGQHLLISEVCQDGIGFQDLYDKVIPYPENEGLVLKDRRGKLEFNVLKSPDVTWQLKLRKPHKNYKF